MIQTLQPIRYDRKDLSDEALLHLYEALVLPRMIEEKMLILLRQNKISKWFSGIGQEAISVGVTEALQSSDYILPLHRSLGVFTSRKVELKKLFCQWQGKKYGERTHWVFSGNGVPLASIEASRRKPGDRSSPP